MSTVTTSNFSDGTDTVGSEYLIHGSAKAWAKFNGTGTPTFDESFNFSSLTDNGTGNYTLSLTNNMNGADYSLSSSGGGTKFRPQDQLAAGSFRQTHYNDTPLLEDAAGQLSTVFGDLA